MSDLTYALREIDKARPGYELARKMYDGSAKETFANDFIRRELSKSAEYYRVNVARKPVTAVLNRLKVNNIAVPDSESATKLLGQHWVDNDLAIEVPGWIEKVGYYGDAYLFSWPGSEIMTEDGVAGGVNLFVHGPECARMFYDLENPRVKRMYVWHWDGDDNHMRVNIAYPDRIERYRSKQEREQLTAGQEWLHSMFVQYGEDDDDNLTEEGHLTNPWGVIPVEHGRTARPYGRPLHADAFGPQNSVTKLIATQMSVTDQYGWPYRYMLSKTGTNGANLADWDKDSRHAPDPRRLPVSTIKARDSRTRHDPGTMNKLKDTDSVGQLEASPASNFIDPISMMIRLLGVVTDTPMDGLNPTGAPESGESRRAKLDGLLARAGMLQLELEGALRRALAFDLTVLGADKTDVVIQWKPLEKITDLDGWLSVQAQEAAGVPIRAALLETGYLPEQIDEWDKSMDSRMDVLERLVNIGVAAGLPVETFAPMFAEFLGEISDGPPAD